MSNTIRIAIASISDFTEKSLVLLQNKKKTSALNPVRPYTFWKDQLRTEVGIVLTEHLLLSAGIHEKALHTLKRNSFGKPFLPNHDIDFNISHSADVVVAIFSNTKDVGIDVEQNRTIDISAYESIFHPKELSFLKAENSTNTFFEVWTKKESLLKARGSGFQIDLSIINVFESKNLRQYFHEIKIPGYTCYACSTFPSDEIIIDNYTKESELFL